MFIMLLILILEFDVNVKIKNFGKKRKLLPCPCFSVCIRKSSSVKESITSNLQSMKICCLRLNVYLFFL